jgi:hypothetical protein
MGGLSIPYATTPMNNSTELRSAGRDISWCSRFKENWIGGISSNARARLAPDHNMLERTTAPRAMPQAVSAATAAFPRGSAAKGRMRSRTGRCKGAALGRERRDRCSSHVAPLPERHRLHARSSPVAGGSATGSRTSGKSALTASALKGELTSLGPRACSTACSKPWAQATACPAAIAEWRSAIARTCTA